MPEDNPTTATSEDTSVQGGSGDGGASGTDSDVGKLTSERDALQAEARQHQSERDRVKAENDRLKAELAAARATSSDETPASTTGLTAEQIAEQVRTAMRQEQARSRELALAEETAKKEYPNALASVYGESYDSAEDLLETARASHETLSGFIAERTEAMEKDIRERYEAVHGPLPTPATTDEQAPPSGDPTIEQLSDMSQAQLDALEKKEPGIIDRIIRSADQLV